MFGPLLAMQAGHNHTVRLQNKLTAPVNDYLVSSVTSFTSVQPLKVLCIKCNTPFLSYTLDAPVLKKQKQCRCLTETDQCRAPLTQMHSDTLPIQTSTPMVRLSHCLHSVIHVLTTRLPNHRLGALQQTFYGSPPACPVLGFSPPCVRKPCSLQDFPDTIHPLFLAIASSAIIHRLILELDPEAPGQRS